MDKLKSISVDQIDKAEKKSKKDNPHIQLFTETDLNLCSHLTAVFILQTNEAFNKI